MIDKDTNERILEVAIELFSQKGYNGVSVREIAKAADVNVASINYHFGSKAELLSCVFEESRKLLEDRISKRSEDGLGFVDLCEELYYALIHLKSRFRNVMKLFFFEETEWKCPVQTMDGFHPGPPGSSYLMNALVKEVGEKNKEDMVWTVQNCAAVIIYKALLISSPHISHFNQQLLEDGKGEAALKSDAFAAGIRRLALMMVNDLKNS